MYVDKLQKNMLNCNASAILDTSGCQAYQKTKRASAKPEIHT